jgi:hypothetical protein
VAQEGLGHRLGPVIGILAVPYEQVDLVTAGYDTAVFENVSNPG